jgi:membrane protease YdiL (CAAX protease family)
LATTDLATTKLATTDSAYLTLSVHRQPDSRNLAELMIGFGAIVLVLWLPIRDQLIFGPFALLGPLAMVLLERRTRAELGLSWRGLVRSLWILPATVALAAASIWVARIAGTYHALYGPNFGHVGGYVLWTIYQQFLLQDYFMPRLTRVLTSDWAIAVAAILFAVAHLPNLPLMAATLLWGAVSCWLFRRYGSLWVLGVAQGLLGLCFVVCLPDAWHHHLRVGLGYLRYHGTK